MSIRRDNHYVPRLYLKRFTGPDGQVWTYRTLVSHENVRLWKKSPPRSVAYKTHLYTQIAGGQATDAIERWLAQDFEAPAEEALQKATTDAQLSPSDWECLVRFLAAQDVRTPSRLAQLLPSLQDTLPEALQKALEDSARTIEKSARANTPLVVPTNSETDDHFPFPFRASVEMASDQKSGYLKGELVLGRSLWLFSMRRALLHTIKTLLSYKWTILMAPKGFSWFTGDNPVIRLNCFDAQNFNLTGSWGSRGTELLLPLSPRHLFYTQIGEKKLPPRGDIMSNDQAAIVRRAIAENAHRMIFASEPDSSVLQLRPRIVDAARLQAENEQWSRWHQEQSAAEQALAQISDLPSEYGLGRGIAKRKEG